MTPASSRRWTRSATAGVESPILRPSSAKDTRAFCCNASRIFQAIASRSILLGTDLCAIYQQSLSYLPIMLNLLSFWRPFFQEIPFSVPASEPILSISRECFPFSLPSFPAQEVPHERHRALSTRTRWFTADHRIRPHRQRLSSAEGHRSRRVLRRQRPPVSVFLPGRIWHVAGRLCRTGNRPARSILLRVAARQDSFRAHHTYARRKRNCRACRPAQRWRQGDGALGGRCPPCMDRDHKPRRGERGSALCSRR